MDCELCGKSGARIRAQIEGVEMIVCEGCAGHGTVLNSKPRSPPHSPKKLATRRPQESEMIDDIHPDVARKLRSYRESKGMTQEEFAKKMNIKASVYAHYEAGDRKPSMDTARQLERVLGDPLVVRIKIKRGSYESTESEGMTIGDIMKK